MFSDRKCFTFCLYYTSRTETSYNSWISVWLLLAWDECNIYFMWLRVM